MKKRNRQIKECLKKANLKYVVVNKNGKVLESDIKPDSKYNAKNWGIPYRQIGQELYHLGDVKCFLKDNWRNHIYLKSEGYKKYKNT